MDAKAAERYANPPPLLDWGAEKFNPDHIKEMESHNQYQLEHRIIHFDCRALNYEQLYARVGYPDPQKVVNYVKQHCKGKDPSSLKILDMGCGTGLVGKYLSEAGFKNITGVDCSSKMLEQAEAKGIYQRLEEVTLGSAESFPPHLKNGFDLVVISGLINNNHLDYQLFEEITMALKQNGLAIFAARFSYMGDFWYNVTLRDLVKDDRWKFINSESFFKYDQLSENVGKFGRTPCKVFCYRNLGPEIQGFKKKVTENLIES